MKNLSWRWANKQAVLIVGNPENRRVRDFAAVWQRLHGRSPEVFSYLELLRRPPPEAPLVRLDSPGENQELAEALAGRRLEDGEVACLQEYHQGYLRLLNQFRHHRCLNHPDEIATMFDKWQSHRLFEQHGLPRPPSRLATGLPSAPRGRLFFKPLHGSSASGVCALRWAPGRQQLLTPLKVRPGGLFNCLKVQRYDTWKEIERILGQLIPQGMIEEQWIPKLTLPGGVVDLRVLVVGGRARHRVVRQSRSPMTNLHLGNARGCERTLQEHLGPRRWQAALELAERAAACFPRCLYAGVDILIDCSGRAYVGEINAYGDLLPHLSHQGQSAYEAIATEAARL